MSPEAQKVRDVFVAAIKLPSEQWEAFLGESCAGDAELRRHVSELLREHQQAGNFLDRPVADVQSTGSFDPAAKAVPAGAQEGPGTLIGPYKLLELIGEGGMGAVWMAEQREPMERKVALKIIKAGMDTRQVLARFETERQALALMDHPNIAKVLDGGASAGGRPYFVMELVKGTPINKYCDEHRLTPRQRLELFLPVCQAIQHAHTKGIIHRDVKPANVLVAPYDGRPIPKVIDFGVAKATGQRLTERTLFTGFGAVVGTLEYMSPEQAELNNQDIDTRSDVYSLGVLLFELLTGTTPLDRRRLKEAAFTEMLRIIRDEDPPKPSARLSDSKDTLPSISAQRHMEPAKLTRLVRGELDWIVMRALEKDRNRRYETANGLAQDVERYLADEPVLACPPSFSYRLRKLVRRNRWPAAAASLVFLALVAGIIGTSWGLVRAEKAHHKARTAQLAEAARAEGERRAREAEVAQRRRAEENARLAVSAVDEMMTGARQRLTPYVPDQPTAVPRTREQEKAERELLEKGLKFYEQLAQFNATDWASRRARARSYESVGRLLSDLRSNTESDKAHREAVRLMEELAQERPDDFDNAFDLADAYHWWCEPYRANGRFQRAENVTRRAIALFKKLVADFPDRRLRAQRGLGYCQRNLVILLQGAGKAQEAEKTFQEFLATWADLLAADTNAPELRDDLARAHFDFAYALQETRHFPQAEIAYRQALAIWEKLGTERPEKREYRQSAASTCGQLASLLLATKRSAEAATFSGRAAELCARLAADFPAEPVYRDLQARISGQLAAILVKTGTMAEAESAYGQAIAHWEKLSTQWPGTPQYLAALASTLRELADLQLRARQYAQAAECNHRAAEIYAKLAAEYPGERMYRQWHAGAAWRVGEALKSAGRPGEAEIAFREAMALYEKLISDYPREPWFRSQLAYTCWLLGGLLRSTGNAQEGERACRQAVANQEKLAADFPDLAGYPQLFTFRGELAENLLQQGKHSAAAEVAEQMADDRSKKPNANQTAAALLARCVSLAEKDAQLSETDRKAAAARYAARARELTRDAEKRREQKTATDEKPKQ